MATPLEKSIQQFTVATSFVSTDTFLFQLAGGGAYRYITGANLLRSAPAGSNTAPSLAFAGDPNTGLYSFAADSISFVTGGTDQWVINSSGGLVPATTNAKDIGNGTANPRDVNLCRSLHWYSSGGTGLATVASTVDGVVLLTDNAGTSFDRLQLGGTSASFPALKRNSSVLEVKVADDSAFAIVRSLSWQNGGGTADIGFNRNGLSLAATFGIFWSSTAASSGSADIGMSRDAAGIARITNGSTGIGALTTALSIVPKTGNYTVVVTDSARLFTNTGAAGEVDFTLPAAALGLVFEFSITVAQVLKVIANTGDTIRIAASVSASAGNISASTIGNCVRLVCIAANKWVAQSNEGTWTVT